MQLHLGHWHITTQRHTPTPRLDALMHDELMLWANQHLRNRARQPVSTRHHVHRHATRDGGTATLEFNDHPSGSYGAYTHVSGSHVDVSMCPTCQP